MTRTSLASLLFLLAAAPAFGQKPQLPPPPPAPAPLPPGEVPVVVPGEVAQAGLPAWPDPSDEALAAGLPRGSKPRVLTLRDAYTLALIRSRSPRPVAADVLLAPARLAEVARSAEADDFARFRADFLSPGEGPSAFRDPAPGFLDLLARRVLFEKREETVRALESYGDTFRKFLGGGSGISQLHVDRIDAALLKAQAARDRAKADYRQALDAFRVGLGLPADAAVVLDRSPLAGFQTVAEAARNWTALRSEDRAREKLDEYVARLPRPPDLTIGGRPVLAVGPDELEPTLSAAVARAAQVAKVAPGPEADRLALRVRGEVRDFLRLGAGYDRARRRLLLAYRNQDRAQDRINAPPGSGGADTSNAVAEATQTLVDAASEVGESWGELVSSWARLQDLKLSLLRELGALPGRDWAEFLSPLTTQPGPAAPPKR